MQTHERAPSNQPRRVVVAAYGSRVDHRTNLALMEAWFEAVQRPALSRGASIDLDVHTVPAHTEQEPLEKHYLSSSSRSQKGILVFLAHDATQRVLCYANASVLGVSATVVITHDQVLVTLAKRVHNPYLLTSGLADEATPWPWFGNKKLVLRFG